MQQNPHQRASRDALLSPDTRTYIIMADLVPYIYHEQQERNGSMLCAQHCLNNLLQQSMYSEVDLSDLARQ